MTILPIFYNVDPSDVRKQKGTFAQPFDEYEKQFEEKVGTWRDALKHVANTAGYHVDNSPLSEVVKSIVSLISHNSSCTFSKVTEGLVGIDSQLVELGSCLALGLDNDVRFTGIWAMGGMGKTTLARVAYKMVSEEFEACCIIYNVREKCETAGGLLSLQKYLISQISKETNLNIEDIYDGVHMIKKRLSHKRILLVLDDVNDLNQLQKLAGKRDWFGRGSRIIITTRDKHLLETHLLDKIYEVKSLKNEDACHLFRSKAFKNELIPYEYLELSKGFLNYVAGHPLALIVLGSFLSKRSVVEWENEFEKLKEHPKPDVIRVLKKSYDGLEGPEQEIFKDIACFFNHEKKDYVVQILEILGRYPHIGLSILIEKSLLKISENNELRMHDLLRDMGRDIVRQESRDEPGKRSRLWHYEDIDNVLKNDTGTEHVQAIDMKGAKDKSIYHEEKEACWRPQGLAPLVTLQGWVLSALSWQGLALLVTLWGWVQKTLSWQGFTSSKKPKGLLWNPNAFLKMHNLKFLRIRSISLQLDTLRLPNNLSYLECNDYPLKSLHSLPAGLVALHLPRSKIELLWGGMKIFENLKSINMDGSSDLIISPNFNGVQNLEELVLARCSNLRQLHPSIGKLKKLRLLDLKGCQELTNLPDKFEMESLVTLNLTYCLKVKKIPEFVGNMELFQELLLEGTAIIELPSSIECLTGLNTLILQNCKNLVRLPNIICSLTSLYNLNLFGCSKFDKLPKDLGNITSLKKLKLSGTAIKELPSSIEFLTSLEALILEDCKNFVPLPSTICSLKSLVLMYLSRCPKFVNLPENIGNLKHLSTLLLEGTAIEVLPSSIGRLAALKRLNLKDCKNLVCLPSTICNLKRVYHLDLTGCSKITNLPENLGNMESLGEFSLGGTAIKELPSSTIHLKQVLFSLSFKGCQLSSSSLTSMPRSHNIDLSDCNLSAIPSGIVRNLSAIPGGIDCITEFRFNLFLRGNDFVSLPESISQFSGLVRLYLDGCKSLRSLPNIPSEVVFICVDNCTSLETLPELPNDLDSCYDEFTVQCFNCFKLACNIQNFSNMFQVSLRLISTCVL
ncbi:disease resistance protein RUN1 isoform X2 [Quercus suber]|uniref:disease resistance protein RUN1 isoform X2 n=1 Tax=Quercus suber TaxID=58331 RepID=UPI0032DEEE14